MEDKLVVTEDAIEELSCLREKIKIVLECVIEDAPNARDQTLTYIATDYLSAMGQTIQAMQETRYS